MTFEVSRKCLPVNRTVLSGQNTFFLSKQSPGEIKCREVELGSQSWMDCPDAELVLNSRFSDTVFVTLFRTAVERAI